MTVHLTWAGLLETLGAVFLGGVVTYVGYGLLMIFLFTGGARGWRRKK